MTLPPEFKEFLKLLNEKGVEYLIVGGYAVGYHGYPRATADMDLWIAVEPQNAERAVQAIREFGFEDRELSSGLFLKPNQIIRMGRPPLQVEIFTSIPGVNFEECYAERAIAMIDELEVSLISLKHLRESKEAAGRHKDLDDLQHLP